MVSVTRRRNYFLLECVCKDVKLDWKQKFSAGMTSSTDLGNPTLLECIAFLLFGYSNRIELELISNSSTSPKLNLTLKVFG
jgi:hypothetical protein